MDTPRLDDRLLRSIGIPAFGIAIPYVAGLFGPHGPRELTHWLGLAWFMGLSWLVWHANRWLLFKEREHVDWFRDPLQKLLLLVAGVVFGTLPITIAMLVAWYVAAGFPSIDWRAIEIVSLTNVICVVFVTHVYETVFLIKEREADVVRVERLERARVEAELESLRAQIDPHFLFNSLNTLSHLIESDPARARDFNERLAGVYRYILSNRTRDLVLLAEELAFVDDYVALLEVRFGGAIRVVNERRALPLDRSFVPPVSVQVLVENAVKHNELSAAAPLVLRIMVEDDRVVVWNERTPRRDVAPSARVGLRNLADRYRLAAQREIDVRDEAGRFTVSLPLLGGA